jgi:hypothetical protein
MSGHLREGRAWLEGMLARQTAWCSPARASALNGAGVLARNQGDYVRAALLTESLAVQRALGDRRGVAHYQEAGDRAGLAACLEGAARAACTRGHWASAARLCGAAEGLRIALAAPLGPADKEASDRMAAEVLTALGHGACATARAAGRGMALEQALAEALDEPPPA